MKIVYRFFIALWKLWYFLVRFSSTVLLAPILFLSLATDRYRRFYKFARIWGKLICYGSGFRIQRTDKNTIGESSHMVVCNHGSEMDIPIIMLLIQRPLVFVGKRELAKIPIFGFLYKKASILVDRSSLRSRRQVYDQVGAQIKRGRSIFMAPEGGRSDRHLRLAPFKDGAFTLAIKHRIPILPITIANAKQRFPPIFCSGAPGRIYVHVHPPIETKGYDLKKRAELRDKTRKSIERQLDVFHKTLPRKAFLG